MHGTMHLDGETLPHLISQIADRKLAMNVIAGADSYAQQHTANVHCATFLGMLTVRQDYKAGRSRGLLSHLRYLSAFCDATDKRDKIYALLGLATDEERSALNVNNAESLPEVYHRTAKLLIEQGNGIEGLYEASCYPHLEGLPSWAPNWDGNRDLESTGWTTAAKGEKSFRASASAKSMVNISADSRLLRIRGVRLDSIYATTEPVRQDLNTSAATLNLGRFKCLWEFEDANFSLAQEHRDILRYPPDKGLRTALWRTLVCNRTQDVAGNFVRPAPALMEKSYLA